MFALTPINPTAFDKLIGRTIHTRKMLKRQHVLRPLIVPSAQQRADGLWREQIFVAADAVILLAIDLLVEAGAARKTVDYAMTDIQVSVIGALTRLDAGDDVELAFAHDGKRFAVITAAATMPDAIHLVVKHFMALGVTDAAKLAVYCIPLRKAYDAVRANAKKHKIAVPPNMWLTPEELDTGAAVVAAAIAPRTSPVIAEWQRRRPKRARSKELKMGIVEVDGVPMLAAEDATLANLAATLHMRADIALALLDDALDVLATATTEEGQFRAYMVSPEYQNRIDNLVGRSMPG